MLGGGAVPKQAKAEISASRCCHQPLGRSEDLVDQEKIQVENYRNKITTAFDQFHVDLNKYREEVNKIIEDIRKKYDVTKTS